MQFQSEVHRNEWVTIEWEMTLPDLPQGSNLIRQNGEIILNELGANLPDQAIFDSLF